MPTFGSGLQTTSTAAQPNLLQSSSYLRKGALVLCGNLLLIASSHAALPHALTPIPSSLQTFAIMFLALTMGPTLSAGAVCAYLVEGALGAPVFAPPFSGGGLFHLFGPTGGFLLAYLPAILLSSFLFQYLAARTGRLLASVTACLAAEIPIFLLGASWLALEAHLAPSQALALAVTPFIAGEAIKVLLALSASEAVTRAKHSKLFS